MTEFVMRSHPLLKRPEGIDAQTVGERLQHLRDTNNGVLTPEIVRADGQNVNSPLYGFFTRDANDALDTVQLMQARALITVVRIRYRAEEPNDGKPKTVRAWVRTEEPKTYEAVEDVMSDEEKRNAALRRAWNDMQRVRKKYESLREFASVFAALDEIEQALPPVIRAA
jgi:hypothetical protein